MMMKAAIMGLALLVSGSALATVVELKDATAKSVLNVYEEMQEQEESPDNGWIHSFEDASVGPEMDHLTGLKRAVAVQEEM